MNTYSSVQYDGINEYINKFTVESFESPAKAFELDYMVHGESEKCAMKKHRVLLNERHVD